MGFSVRFLSLLPTRLPFPLLTVLGLFCGGWIYGDDYKLDSKKASISLVNTGYHRSWFHRSYVRGRNCFIETQRFTRSMRSNAKHSPDVRAFRTPSESQLCHSRFVTHDVSIVDTIANHIHARSTALVEFQGRRIIEVLNPPTAVTRSKESSGQIQLPFHIA